MQTRAIVERAKGKEKRRAWKERNGGGGGEGGGGSESDPGREKPLRIPAQCLVSKQKHSLNPLLL